MLDDLPLDQPMPFRDADGMELLDLHELLVPRPLSTFFMRVSGHGMRGHGVLDGGLLVIDLSIAARPGHLVVAEHRGEFLLRPLGWEDGQWILEPVRPGEVAIPVEIDNLDQSPLFGVAVHAVHHVGPRETRR
jgi:DNA polymerase V